MPGTYVWTPREITDELEKLLGVTAAFAWHAGDGNSPYRGPSLSLTGSPSLMNTPWLDRSGSAIQAEVHTGSSYRNETHTAVDPAAGEDVVGVGWMRAPPEGSGSTEKCLATKKYGRGLRLACYDVNACVINTAYGDSSPSTVTATGSVRQTSWCFFFLILDRDGNFWSHLNGSTAIDITATPSGSLGDAEGIALGARPNGTTNISEGGAIVMGAFFYGSGIADLMTQARVTRLSNAAMGIYAEQGDQGDFSRDSHAAWQNHNGVWHIASNGMPRSGDTTASGVSGLRSAPPRTNKAYRNIDPQNVTALSETGGTAPTTVDDSTALEADDCGAWGPHVYDYDNDTGNTQHIRFSDTTGNTDTHCYQCLARVVSGAGTVKLGLYDESANTFTGTAIHDGYDSRTLVHDVTPGDTDETLALEVPDGVNVRWIAQDMCEGTRCSSPIPNWATAASASTPNERYSIDSKYRIDAQGSVEVEWTPLGWDSANLPGKPQVYIVRNSLIYIQNGRPVFYDGTNAAVIPGISFSDGVRHIIRSRWFSDKMSISFDDERDDCSYDGDTFGSGSDISITQTDHDQAEHSVSNVKILKNGSG